KQDEDIQMSQLTQRERRFIKFASVEYDGQLYMTPQDFLDSVTETDPRPRLKRKILTKKELHSLYDSTPPRRKGNTNLFRSLHDKGIISYTEYLFLLSVLTKPQSGFRIAFNMFDTDGNQRVDKKEFLVVLHLLVKSFFKRTAESIGLYSGVSPAVIGIVEEDIQSSGILGKGCPLYDPLLVAFLLPSLLDIGRCQHPLLVDTWCQKIRLEAGLLMPLSLVRNDLLISSMLLHHQLYLK
ncbi:calcium uptake protein 3, mitochondrial, partial [Trichonephila inaurata madagascariensis]